MDVNRENRHEVEPVVSGRVQALGKIFMFEIA